MFISQAYYCRQIHHEKISNSESVKTKPENKKNNIFSRLNWNWNKKKAYSKLFKV